MVARQRKASSALIPGTLVVVPVLHRDPGSQVLSDTLSGRAPEVKPGVYGGTDGFRREASS